MNTEAQTTGTMDIQQILDSLPHRYPFLLVDRVESVVPGERIVCLKNVTINEPFFVGHFPQRAVMPGVLLIESMAQACGLLAFKTREAEPDQPQRQGGELFYLVGVDNAKFKRRVEPGDQLSIVASVRRTVRGIWLFDARAHVGEGLAASAEIRCTMRAA